MQFEYFRTLAFLLLLVREVFDIAYVRYHFYFQWGIVCCAAQIVIDSHIEIAVVRFANGY